MKRYHTTDERGEPVVLIPAIEWPAARNFGARALFWHLCDNAEDTHWTDTQPEHLARRMGVTVRTVGRWLDWLQAAGAIELYPPGRYWQYHVLEVSRG